MLRFASLVYVVSLAALSGVAAGAPPDSAQAAAENGLRPAGAPPNSPKFTIEARMRFHHVPGVSLAVIDDGQIAWAKGYGVLHAGHPAPVTAESRFQAASVSKPVASMGALALVEKGKLSLDAPVNTELRTWKLPENDFTRQTPVTLRMLLSHSAGMNVHGFGGYPAKVPLPTINQILDGQPPANSPPLRVEEPPGVRVKYSGGGMIVMQKMIEDAAGVSFAEYMEAAVFRPIGMTHSTYRIVAPLQPNPAFATAHDEQGQPIEGRWHRYPESTAAGLWTTAGDLARYIIELQQSRAGNANRVLSQKMTNEMLTPQKGTAGLGIFFVGNGPGRRFTHNGANAGFRSLFVGFFEQGKGIAVLANSDSADKLIHEIVQSVAEAYDWPNKRQPSEQ
jgi:CubicO group peptidase (beta-lactamase class C family)